MPEGTNPFVSLDGFAANFRAKLEASKDVQEMTGEKCLDLPNNPMTVGERVISEQDWADTQIANSTAAGDRWHKRVLRPKRNPVEAAIAANGKRKQRLEQSEREGRWLASMKRVDTTAMAHTIEAAGPSVYTQGIRIREEKIRNSVKENRAMVLALTEELDKLPTDTPEQREAKMIAAKRGMEQIGKLRRGIK